MVRSLRNCRCRCHCHYRVVVRLHCLVRSTAWYVALLGWPAESGGEELRRRKEREEEKRISCTWPY